MVAQSKDGTFHMHEFALDEIEDSCSWIVIGGPGSGKCFAPGTRVQMFDGTIKKVEDVRVGDLLQGDDGTPRCVLSTTRGLDRMYTVKQYHEDRDNYVVNAPHTLCLLKRNSAGLSSNSVVEMEVNDFVQLPAFEQADYVGCAVLKNGKYIPYDITVSYSHYGEYFGFEITDNRRFLLADNTLVHNTTLLKDIIYTHKHKYPIAKIFSGSEDSNGAYEKIIPKLYITNGYDDDQMKDYILRQKRCKVNGCLIGKGFLAIDDCSDQTGVYKSPTYKGLYKNGSRHWNGIIITGLQYGVDMTTDTRKCASYIAIFFEPDPNEREKLYKHYGGPCGSRADFEFIMDEMVKGDDPSDKYTCMIIKRLNRGVTREENVFYYKARASVVNKTFKFGCKEYKDWDKERRDPKKAAFGI